MSNLNTVLNTSKTALLTAQEAISITSHNISNANTPGYTRQIAVTESNTPVAYGGLYFGTGVTLQRIERVYDGFQGSQLRNSNSALSMYDTEVGLLKNLESTLNDFGDTGLSAQIDDFFNSFQTIANDPSSYAERSVLLSNASVMTDSFNNIDSAISSGLEGMNAEIENLVTTVNGIASQIAGLNQQISTVEVAGVSANDLRDKRDVLLDDLSKIIDVQTVENDIGQTDVYVAGGISLVTGVKTVPLEVSVNEDSPAQYEVVSKGTVINERMTGGSLKGVLDAGTRYIDVRDDLNTMAASMTKEVNLAHRQGYGLDGSTGTDFFSSIPVSARSSAYNTGGAVISSAAVTDLSLVTLDDYEVRFSDAANYAIVNMGTGQVAATGLYASGSPITIDGISFTIADNTGAPKAGDTFMVSTTDNAASSFGVSLDDPNKVAASSTLAGIPGDNANAFALASLKDSNTINGSTFSEFYGRTVIDLGVAVSSATARATAERAVNEQLYTAKQSVSGVSIEEEAISLVKLQRAYEAAAQVMSTADRMLETLLNIR